jgi:hypothetical protein
MNVPEDSAPMSTPEVGGGAVGVVRLSARVSSLAWWFGAAFLPLIAFAAVIHLAAAFGSTFETAWLEFPYSSHVWFWLALAAVAAIVVGLALLLKVVDRNREAWLLPIGLVVLVLTRLAAIAVVHPPLISDWAKYFRLAQQVQDGGPRFADVPTGLPIIDGLLFRIFGANVLVGEFTNLAASLLTGVVVYLLAKDVFGRRAAGVALYIYATLIAQFLMVTVFGTEVLFAAFVSGAVLLMLRSVQCPGRRALVAAFGAGAALGVSQYIRTDAEYLLPAFLVLPFLAVGSVRRAGQIAAACLVAFMLVVAPVVAWNRTTYGEWSVSTSNFAGWSLLVGTDTATSGQYGASSTSSLPSDTSTREFNDQAMAAALRRLESNPGIIGQLAVAKVVPMWGNENYAAVWVFDQSDATQDGARSGVALASQILYVGMLVAAVFGLGLVRGRRPDAITLVLLILGATALAHTFVEVQPRYHFFAEPLLCVLAGGGIVNRLGQRGRVDADSAGRESPAILLPA